MPTRRPLDIAHSGPSKAQKQMQPSAAPQPRFKKVPPLGRHLFHSSPPPSQSASFLRVGALMFLVRCTRGSNGPVERAGGEARYQVFSLLQIFLVRPVLILEYLRNLSRRVNGIQPISACYAELLPFLWHTRRRAPALGKFSCGGFMDLLAAKA
jgi:hypothetical protein